MTVATRLVKLLHLDDPTRRERRQEKRLKSAALSRGIQSGDPRGDMGSQTGVVGGTPDRYQGKT